MNTSSQNTSSQHTPSQKTLRSHTSLSNARPQTGFADGQGPQPAVDDSHGLVAGFFGVIAALIAGVVSAIGVFFLLVSHCLFQSCSDWFGLLFAVPFVVYAVVGSVVALVVYDHRMPAGAPQTSASWLLPVAMVVVSEFFVSIPIVLWLFA